ncbi:hypothetical protein LguiA_022174 [Lonicera macranthoides]
MKHLSLFPKIATTGDKRCARHLEAVVVVLSLCNEKRRHEIAELSAFDVYKILIYDKFCQDILSPLIHVKDLCKHSVTLYFLINKDWKPVQYVPVVYFIHPTHFNVQRIIFQSGHLGFVGKPNFSLVEREEFEATHIFQTWECFGEEENWSDLEIKAKEEELRREIVE